MKRFAWPLQRYLDVVRQREDLLCTELSAAAARVAAAAEAIRRRREAMAAMLRDISQLPQARRYPQQQIVVGCEPAERKAVAAMEAEMAKLEARRQELLSLLREIRTRRQTLEKLREEARAQHLRQADLEEQKQHDQTSQIAFVRRSAARQADLGSMTA